MAQQLRGLSVLVVDLASELSIHIVETYNSLYPSFRGSGALYWPPWARAQMWCT